NITVAQAVAIYTCNPCFFSSIFGWLNTINHAVPGAFYVPSACTVIIHLYSACKISTSTTLSRNQSQSKRFTSPAKQTINLEKPVHIIPGNKTAKRLLKLLPPQMFTAYKILKFISGFVTLCVFGQVKEVTKIKGPTLLPDLRPLARTTKLPPFLNYGQWTAFATTPSG
ncbi:uncharacterized protein PpBr36_11100, partial [Pyricularia pennisetigena]|uniref:uncharacterized protein n=1 Tax=Pyricularia pennisetigena TaxID=1578925 RepID=UPI0011539EB5